MPSMFVSALFPSEALTSNGNPEASASTPVVICGWSRRSTAAY